MRQELNSIKTQIRNMTARGEITLVNDAEPMQEVQVDLVSDETQDGLQRIQNYGMTTYVPAGAECLALFHDGLREDGQIIAAEDPEIREAALQSATAATSLPLQTGDVLIYTSNENFVLLRAGTGNVVIHSPETIRLQAANIELAATESIKVDVSGRGYTYYPTHTDTWEQCTVPGSSNPCMPPEHPPIKAQ